MIPFAEMNVQNHQIAELAKVLSRLVVDREMCDTDVVCELFDRYTDRVDNHLNFNAQHIYSILLSHPDRTTNGVANKFLEGEREIKRLFKGYIRKWCRNGLRVDDHQRFIKETNEMFDLVWDRIQAESEELYPLAREVESEFQAKVA